MLFALASAPTALARSLLDDVVTGDARLAWRGASVGLSAPPGADVRLEDAHFVVVDLETTGLSPRTSRICEIGAQRVRALELEDAFETLVDPRVALPAAVVSLTGIRADALRGAPRTELAVRRFLAFAGDAAIVAHNARFDLAFLDREVELLTGRRIAAPVVDTVWLARRLLGERTRRVGLAALARFFGVPTEPCHRALPDARATAEILVVLVGLAQERGARTLADLVELAAPRARRLHTKRSLVAGAPPRPGRVRLPRPGRAPALRRAGTGSSRPTPLVLRRRTAEAGRRGRARRARGGGVARDRLRARRRARGAAAAPRAAPARQRAQHAAGPPRVPEAAREPLERDDRGHRARAAFGPSVGSTGRARARRPRLGRRGDRAPGAPPPRATPRARAPLRGRRAAARSARRSRGGRRRHCASSSGCGRFAPASSCPRGEAGFARAHAIAGGRVAATRLLPCGAGAAHEAAALVADASRTAASRAPEDADELRLVAVVPPTAAAGAARVRTRGRGDLRAGRRATLGRVTSDAAGRSRVRSPTASPTPSSASARSSSSGSTRSSTSCPSSCAERRRSVARLRRGPSSGSARGSSTPSRPTSSR